MGVLEQVGVDAELEDRPGLGLSSELGVKRFVRPGAEIARHVDAAEEVDSTRPAVVLKGGLVDDVDPLAHGGEGHFHAIGRSTVPGLAGTGDRKPFGPQAFQVRPLVRKATGSEVFENRGVSFRALHLASRRP